MSQENIDDIYNSDSGEIDFPDIEKITKWDLDNTVKAYNLLSSITSGGSITSVIDAIPTKDLEAWFRKKKSEHQEKDVEEDVEEQKKKVLEHNAKTGDNIPVPDPEKEKKDVENRLKKQAKERAGKSRDDISVQFKALKNSLGSKSSAFEESIKLLVKSIPTQIATIAANPYTANTVPAMALQFMTTISALITVASTVVETAMILYLPLPASFTETIQTAVALKSAMSGILGVVDSIPNLSNNPIYKEINTKITDATNARNEKKAKKSWLSEDPNRTENDWKALPESIRKNIIDEWVKNNPIDDDI